MIDDFARLICAWADGNLALLEGSLRGGQQREDQDAAGEG